MHLLVIGSGKMGQAYASVLDHFDIEYAIYAPSTNNFSQLVDRNCSLLSGSLEVALTSLQPTHLILASPINTLANLSLYLVQQTSVEKILIEKPGFINYEEFTKYYSQIAPYSHKILYGFNRRFYSSFAYCRKHLSQYDGKINSIKFCFDEYYKGSSNRPSLHYPASVLSSFLFANAIHVIDSAFMLSDLPDLSHSFFTTSGSTDWHPQASSFSGQGLTTNHIPFTYVADWSRSGKWSIEWKSDLFTYTFAPLESLNVTNHFTGLTARQPIDDLDDVRFKPGLYKQTRSFLTNTNVSTFHSLDTLAQLLKLTSLIACPDNANPGDHPC